MAHLCVMAKNSLSLSQKKDYAKTLYLNNRDLNQKEIAQRVDVTEKTIGNWIKEGEWEVLRRSLLVSKSDQIARLYKTIENVQTKIDEMEGIGDTKMADMMIKYTAAAKNLENDTSVAEMVDTMMKFGTFVQRHYPDHFKVITDMSDAFVMEKLN